MYYSYVMVYLINTTSSLKLEIPIMGGTYLEHSFCDMHTHIHQKEQANTHIYAHKTIFRPVLILCHENF